MKRFALLIITSAILFSCSRAPQAKSEFILATVCTITFYDYVRPQVYRDIFTRLKEIENRMSAYIDSSDVNRINRAAGLNPVQVHPDVFGVIERAVHFAKISDGAFDPTVGPLVFLWGIGFDHEKLPAQEEIEKVLPLVGWEDIELDRSNYSVFLKKTGMALDLGAIAKGFAADEAAAIIKKAGIKRAIIDLGGNILLVGERKNKGPWRVGIQNPLENRGNYIGIAEVFENSVVTSGVYERFFEENGVRYHHLFSPSSGYPADNGLLSVTIITGVSAVADALSTAVFVLGYDKGRALVDSLDAVEAIFVFTDKSIKMSGGVNFTLNNTNYTIMQ